MRQEIIDFFEDAEQNDRPGCIAVSAFMAVRARQRGHDVSIAVEYLRTFTRGEVKAAIRIIRTLPEIQNKDYPLEEMVRFLRYEVMGKEVRHEDQA